MLRSPSLKRIDFLSLLCVFTFVFCLVPLCFTATEQITLTTYYPAPYGNYQTLNTQTLYANSTYTDALAVGRAYRDAPLYDGLLIVSEKVGIGTAAPRVDVHLDQPTFAAMRISSPVGYNSALQLYDNNAPPSYGVGVTPNSGWAILKEFGTGNLRINRDNQENNGTRADLTITRTIGNIGIGTTTPQSPAPNAQAGNLDVNDIYLRSQNRWLSQQPNYPFFNVNPNGLQSYTQPNLANGLWHVTVFGRTQDAGNSASYWIRINVNGQQRSIYIQNHPDGTAPFSMTAIVNVVTNNIVITTTNCFIYGISAYRI